MSNENEEIVDDLDTNEDESNDSSEDTNDSTDWEAKAKEFEGRLKRAETKLGKKANPEKKESKKSNELDYGQKAFLVANGIKGVKETELVKDFMEQTGKSLDDVLESKYFLNELKDLRDITAVNDAVKDTSKRGTGVARDSVDYWIAKGELPPVSETQLRRDVVNAKIKNQKEGGMFYNSK